VKVYYRAIKFKIENSKMVLKARMMKSEVLNLPLSMHVLGVEIINLP
jgi:hypothetical protein